MITRAVPRTVCSELVSSWMLRMIWVVRQRKQHIFQPTFRCDSLGAAVGMEIRVYLRLYLVLPLAFQVEEVRARPLLLSLFPPSSFSSTFTYIINPPIVMQVGRTIEQLKKRRHAYLGPYVPPPQERRIQRVDPAEEVGQLKGDILGDKRELRDSPAGDVISRFRRASHYARRGLLGRSSSGMVSSQVPQLDRLR